MKTKRGKPDGTCEWARCRAVSDLRYLGVDLCFVHWSLHCDECDKYGDAAAEAVLEKRTGKKLERTGDVEADTTVEVRS